MIEIIPNWHPIFVHFTVALFSATTGFYAFAYVAAKLHLSYLSKEFEIVSRWCLWAVALITIGTVLAGLYAYSTVNHDTASHLAMTNHRNWALPTAVAILLLAIWSFLRYRRQKNISILFLVGLLIAQGALLSTAWRGGELVYRYGLGVMSLPQAEGMGHQHQHPEGAMTDRPQTNMPNTEPHDHPGEDKH